MAPESSKPEHPPAQADALPPADQPGLLARLFTLLPSLRAQLIVPYALLTVLIAMLGIYIITRLVTSSFRERFVNQLHEASRVTADGIVRQERAHLENLRVMAFTGGVSQAMANSDVGTLQTLLCPLVLNYSIDALTAVDRGGRELVTLAANASAQECIASRQDVDLSQTPLVANILNLPPNATADKFAGLLTLPPEAVYLFSSAPVRDPNAQIVGVLMIGTRLPELLADLQTQAHADIMVLGGEGKLLATTLSEPDEGYAVLDMEPQVVSSLDLSLMRDLRLYERGNLGEGLLGGLGHILLPAGLGQPHGEVDDRTLGRVHLVVDALDGFLTEHGEVRVLAYQPLDGRADDPGVLGQLLLLVKTLLLELSEALVVLGLE